MSRPAGWTAISNAFCDQVLNELKLSEIKLYVRIARLTTGFRKDRVEVGETALRQAMQLSKGAFYKAKAALIDLGLIQVEEGAKCCVYRLSAGLDPMGGDGDSFDQTEPVSPARRVSSARPVSNGAPVSPKRPVSAKRRSPENALGVSCSGREGSPAVDGYRSPGVDRPYIKERSKERSKETSSKKDALRADDDVFFAHAEDDGPSASSCDSAATSEVPPKATGGSKVPARRQPLTDEQESLAHRLLAWGMDEKAARRFAAERPPQMILDALKEVAADPDIRNPAGSLFDRLSKGGYGPSKAMVARESRRAAADRKEQELVADAMRRDVEMRRGELAWATLLAFPGEYVAALEEAVRGQLRGSQCRAAAEAPRDSIQIRAEMLELHRTRQGLAEWAVS